MKRHLAIVACGALLVLSLGQISAFAADSTTTQGTADSSSMTNGPSDDDSPSSATSPVSTSEKGVASPAEDMVAEGIDESRSTSSGESISTGESASESGQPSSSGDIQNEGLVNTGPMSRASAGKTGPGTGA